MKIRDNLGGLVTSANKLPGGNSSTFKPQIGKVFAVIIDENTPSKEIFEKNGSWDSIGTVLYLDYEQSKNIDIIDLNICKKASPFYPQTQDYPLIGELIYIIDAPSPLTQISNNASKKYYLGTVNIWNNNQQNAISGDKLGFTFIESSDIRNLRYFEGDRIFQGRKGNGLRFGSTVKLKSNLNEWSNTGKDGDPITILVNGYITDNTGFLKANIEEINKEKSSIYLTTTQTIPLKPSTDIKNPRINTILSKDYSFSQIILNSDRITLNSKKDEILLFSKTNIELNSDNIINFNSKKATHINSPLILLGTNKSGEYPDEPALLGGKTHDLFLRILDTFTKLAGFLSTASIPTPEGNILITDCNLAGEQLLSDIENLNEQLSTITSDKVFIS